MFYCNSSCVTHDQLKRDIYVKEHKYACNNWSTDPDFSRHGFSFSKHVRASRHVFRLCRDVCIDLNFGLSLAAGDLKNANSRSEERFETAEQVQTLNVWVDDSLSAATP